MEITEEQAIKLSKTGWWKRRTDHEIVEFQLFQSKLCMPFDRFHQAVEKALDRPVFTHEFASTDLLKKEFRGEQDSPTLAEILKLIPEMKLIVVTHK